MLSGDIIITKTDLALVIKANTVRWRGKCQIDMVNG